jgi:hypothetical protein
MRHVNLLRIACIALFAAALAARLGLHPNTPYKSFLFSLAPVAGAWLVLGTWLTSLRWRIVLAVTAAAASVMVAMWTLMMRPGTGLPPVSVIPALTGVWLGLMLIAALLTGALNAWLRPGPMTVLGGLMVIYALASGFVALPAGATVMTAGMLWLAAWQAVYIYQVKIP